MQTLGQVAQTAVETLPGNPRDSGFPQSIARTLSARSKEQLATLMEQVCALQKQYGKTPAELEILVEGFSWVLADYSMAKIMAAIREYITNSSDIPAPADIVKIIKAKEKPTVAEATIEQLLRYREKNIPLSEQQKLRLAEAGYDRN